MVSCAMRIVSSRSRRRNNSGRNVNIFKARKIGRFLNRKVPDSAPKTALERALEIDLELALGVVWCADPARRFKRDERPCANVVAGQAFSPAGENRYPPPRMVRMTAGLVGSGSILRRMRMILRSTARS